MTCIVTAIHPDGTRQSLTVEADSLNRACIVFNAEAVFRSSASLRKPEQDTTFEVEVGDNIYRITWARVLAWANRQQK